MTERARELRKQAPVPERLLWGLLRDRRLGGLKFRRQVPIGPYVADYFCAERALVIELDGMSHEGRQAQDAARQAYLESRGLRVLRVSNDDVIHNLDAVGLYILQTCGRSPVPSPASGEVEDPTGRG